MQLTNKEKEFLLENLELLVVDLLNDIRHSGLEEERQVIIKQIDAIDLLINNIKNDMIKGVA